MKEAENLSDLNSGTDKEEMLKKSRKIRAAKSFDEEFTSSSNEVSSDNDSFISKIPQLSQTAITQRRKGANVSRKGKSIIK